MGPVTDTSLDERTDVRLSEGDHERFAHIIRKSDQMRGYVMGEEVVALCGKRWVPTRDPERFPVCPECKATLDALTGATGGGDRR
jgi:hypothetical protein